MLLRNALLTLVLLTVTFGLAQATPNAPAPVPDSAAAVRTLLLRQATYWLAQGQPDRAQRARDQLLLLDPASAEATSLRTRPTATPAPADDEADRLIDSGLLQAAETALRSAPADTATQAMPPPGLVATKLAAPTPDAGITPWTASLRQPAPPLPPPAPGSTLATNLAVLRRDPTNLQARRRAFDAALAMGDMTTAAALAAAAVQLAPNDPATWLMSADLDHASGDRGKMLRDLQTARDLRRERIEDDPDRVSLVVLIADAAPPTPAPDSDDPLTSEISRRITAVEDDLAPKIWVGPSVLYQSGTSGLSQIVDVSGKLEASASPGGTGRLTLAVTPTYLDAGNLSSGNQAEFGTAILGNGNAPAPPGQSAAGVGLDITYQRRWLKADIGATPFGFREQDVLGGVGLSPRLSENLVLRIEGERRPVTESLLSYAGTSDPRTGTPWGGVMRTRLRGQLDLTAGLADLYAGGGYSWLDGHDVATNEEVELGAGGSYPVWRSDHAELRAGLDLVYLSYRKNLGGFTLGQGGYFSPQSSFDGLVPLRYRETDGRFSWSLVGQIGYQTYHEDQSPIFPASAALQDQLESQIASGSNAGASAFYPSQSVSGFVGGAGGSFEYKITPSWAIGGQVGLQYTNDWREAEGTVYARHIFNEGQR